MKMKKILLIVGFLIVATIPLVSSAQDALRVKNLMALGMPAAVASQVASISTPTVTNTYDLGSSSIAWRNLYLSGDAILSTSGKTVSLQEGTAASACMGVSTPNGQTPVAVTTTCATTGSRVIFSRVGAITNMGIITTTTAPSGTGFSYAGGGASDTLAGSVIWFIIKESA